MGTVKEVMGEWNRASECTVKPPNNGHIRGKPFVCCREVVPISELVP